MSPSDHQNLAIEKSPAKKDKTDQNHRSSESKKSNFEEGSVSWKDGKTYGSDEYEVVEVKVSKSDDATSSNANNNVLKKELKAQNNPYSEQPEKNLKASSAPEDHSDNKKEPSGSSRNLQQTQPDSTQKLQHLHLDEPHFVPVHTRPTSKFNSTASSLPTTPNLSPAALRKVKDDQSWITRRPLYRFGTK